MSQIVNIFKLKTKKLQEKDWKSLLYTVIGDPIEMRDLSITKEVHSTLQKKYKILEPLLVGLIDSPFKLVSDPLKFSARKFVKSEWYKELMTLSDRLIVLDKEFNFMKSSIDQQYVSRFLTQPIKLDTYKWKNAELRTVEQFEELVELTNSIEDFNSTLFTPLYDVEKFISLKSKVLESYVKIENFEKSELIFTLVNISRLIYKFQLFNVDKDKVDFFSLIINITNSLNTSVNSVSKLVSIISKVNVDSQLFEESECQFINKSQRVLNELTAELNKNDKKQNITDFVISLLNIYNDEENEENEEPMEEVEDF